MKNILKMCLIAVTTLGLYNETAHGGPGCHGKHCGKGDWHARRQAMIDAVLAQFKPADQATAKAIFTEADTKFPRPEHKAGQKKDWKAHHAKREEKRAWIIAQLEEKRLPNVAAAFKGAWAAKDAERHGHHHRRPQ
jgi:hypothetical protein